MPDSIFVSYSRQDVGLVQPVVRLLRATMGLVFQDLDSIEPGRRWRQEIEEALHAAQLFVLFWCYHSSRSAEVKKEYELALTMDKKILPLLLDTTPLPQQLNEFQGIDFQQAVSSAHRSYRRWVISTVVSVLIIGLLAIGFYITLEEKVSGPPASIDQPHFSEPPEDWRISPPERTRPSRPPRATTSVFALALLTLLVATIGTLVIWIGWKTRRRWARAAPTDYQQQMAEQIQVELFRRGIGSV